MFETVMLACFVSDLLLCGSLSLNSNIFTRLAAYLCYSNFVVLVICRSLSKTVVLSSGDFRDDAGIRGQVWLLWGEHVAGCGDELSLVVCTSVANDNLGGVFVGHYDGWTRKSAAMSISIISHQRLLNHTSMQVRSNFECIPEANDHKKWVVTV